MTDPHSLIDKHPGIWRANRHPSGRDRFETGHTPLDNALNGGISTSGLVRICSASAIGEVSVFSRVLQAHRQHKLVMFINAPGRLQGDWLTQRQLCCEQVFQLSTPNDQEALWAAEQCLKSASCHAVLLWCSAIHPKQARRLHVAATSNDALIFLYMPETAKHTALPVSLDLQLNPTEEGLCVRIKKQLGGWPVDDIRFAFSYVPTNAPISRIMETDNTDTGVLRTVS